MRRVAQDHRPAPKPVQKGAHREQTPPYGVIHSADHLGYRGMPALEGRERFARLDRSLPAIARPRFRPFNDRKEVDVLAVTANRVMQQVSVRSHPELKGLRVR